MQKYSNFEGYLQFLSCLKSKQIIENQGPNPHGFLEKQSNALLNILQLTFKIRKIKLLNNI